MFCFVDWDLKKSQLAISGGVDRVLFVGRRAAAAPPPPPPPAPPRGPPAPVDGRRRRRRDVRPQLDVRPRRLQGARPAQRRRRRRRRARRRRRLGPL